MAQTTVVQFTSDLSGTNIRSDSPTVQFSLDGTNYEIDLTDAEQRKMRDALALFVAEGRKANTGPRRAAKTAARSSRSDASEVRIWAHENGMDVPERGRIPAAVREAYESR